MSKEYVHQNDIQARKCTRRRIGGWTVLRYIVEKKAPPLGFFEYEFVIMVEKVRWPNRGTFAIFTNIATLDRDLIKSKGTGLYKLWVLYRSPYELGWELAYMSRFPVRPSAKKEERS